ncbi:hypothetical protein COV82_04185 [Candidatus Peregrinibacteria bacterium CG11_big_fil_rev_8_21_14_0_20_46_8]|nr:MAG: hypothetical protein COV82_04185 [Candidatus Peregrinibacteria bacterium CG11_big_fil_rev_8_21_14_0_20_46_8]
MRILIAHGFRASPQQPGWLLWLAALLEKAGMQTYVPQFPNPHEPQVHEWVDTINQTLDGNFEEAVLIGHSLGGLAILKALEQPNDTNADKAAAVILVGTPIDDVGREQIIDFLPPLDWQKLKTRAQHFGFFYSEDDPYVPLAHGQQFAELLDGHLQSFKDRGHFEQKEFLELAQYLEHFLNIPGNFNW